MSLKQVNCAGDCEVTVNASCLLSSHNFLVPFPQNNANLYLMPCFGYQQHLCSFDVGGGVILTIFHLRSALTGI